MSVVSPENSRRCGPCSARTRRDVHADGPWRHRKNPPRHRSGTPARPRVSRRHGRHPARQRHESGQARFLHRFQPEPPRSGRDVAGRCPLLVPALTRFPPGSRQLRTARGRRLHIPRRSPRGFLAPQDSGHEPDPPAALDQDPVAGTSPPRAPGRRRDRDGSLGGISAIRLFVARAKAASPGFELTDANILPNRRHLPAFAGSPARDRTRGVEGSNPAARDATLPPVEPAQAVDGRRPGPSPAAADHARGHRLGIWPPFPGGTGTLRHPRRFRRRLLAGGRLGSDG